MALDTARRLASTTAIPIITTIALINTSVITIISTITTVVIITTDIIVILITVIIAMIMASADRFRCSRHGGTSVHWPPRPSPLPPFRGRRTQGFL